MIGNLISFFASLIVNIISSGGYFSVTVLMALESACIPIPSEIVMPFSGFLVSIGRFSLLAVALWATVGNLIGSLIAYLIGFYDGRYLLEKYGKYILISHRDIKKADRLFEKHGFAAVFFGRLMPVARTFISLPAGIARMNLKRFILYTFLGSLPWNLALAYLGLRLGERWEALGVYFHKFDFLVGVIIILAIVWWVRRHLRESNPKFETLNPK